MRIAMGFVLLCAAVSSSFEIEAQVRRNFFAAGTTQRSIDTARMRRPPSVVAAVPGFNVPWYFGGSFVGPDLFYRPFSWAAPIYPAPIVPAPIYLAPLYTPSPYIVAKQTKSITPTPNPVEELSYRLGRLTREIERMRREGRQTPQEAEPESGPSPETTVLPTTLVFRDGHRMEIQDYAIADQTLWIFMERGSTRIPITDLDLEMTRDVNAQRGVRFPLPK
jgi:hypothetical protein